MTKLTKAQLEALEAPLDRARVKTRKQAGRDVSYIESWHAESEANRIFGYDGWDSKIKDLRVVSERAVTIGKGGQYEKPGWSVSYVCTVAVVVFVDERGPVIREGVGAGHGIDADLGQAHESAVKEAASDAEKRALKTWGNQFGLALYDKTQANVATAEPAERREATKTTGATAPTPPTLAQRADRLESAMRAQKTAEGLRKAYSLASGLCAELDDKDPERLSELERLYETLFARFTTPKADEFGLNGDNVPALN